MNITAITTACHRPEAFAICEQYMARQTVKPFQWLVLDDDANPTVCTAGQEYYYWPEFRGRGSLAKKVRRALENNLVKGDAIAFVENDDYYSADYMAWMTEGLGQFSLYGEGRALYYNVPHRWWFEHVNLKHASLCATGITKQLFPWLLKQCQISDEPFLDVRLWNNAPGTARVYDPYSRPDRHRHSVGIKGMPGLTGYGGGHRGRDKSAVDDPQLVKLRSLIGADAELYAKFYDGSAPPLPPERNGHIAKQPARPMNLNTHIAHSEAGRVHGENWKNWLAEFRGKKVVGLEIGTFEGDSAEWFLENVATHPDSRFHCVDPFTGADDHRFHNIDTSKTEERTRAKLARFPNVVIHKAYSQDKLYEFKKGTFDWGYIDGSHTARDTLRDGVLVFDLLKVGGVGIFDDFLWTAMPNELDRPKPAIDAFLKLYGKQLRVLEPRGYQIAFRKIAD